MDVQVPTPDLDPFEVFLDWYGAAVARANPLPDAMQLATANASARPSLRTVLYKGMSDRRLRFFTDYRSRKANELDQNPWAAVSFHWKQLGRQVRIEGRVERLSAAESDAYFAGRAWSSRISALASTQSQPLSSRDELVERAAALAARFAGQDPPRPPSWGGYALAPTSFEFWVDGVDRLHERYLYQSEGAGWSFTLLSP
jgi:pyridoxamine 5'-phosphate oxidase